MREAFRELDRRSLAPARKAELTRRLLAVTAAAKHDANGALRRLEGVLAQIRAEPPEPREG